ncbi:hypothetical protein AXE80_07165 [Wenyingzhuangia fucanilytica]|uniref:DUF3822 domain-containing protein n=1 Tax=Wenyingzhuangia fucanilytica TaxID=1790137 RepID=A0A1B1Y5P9_9FLAO|nr:DUF3822 family protein [Wenyingzhuangia fucanilytica]ANW96069.1 hypothetical protein AXE80_07165 [Wenyingzhuangia fucanilytica]
MSKETLIHNHKKLSIQLSSDGFSFCVYSNQQEQYEHVVSIPFSTKITTPTSILEEVKNIFENNVLLHETYEEVILIHHNELNTFVPQAFFSEEILNNYLQNTVKVFDNDYVSYDELDELEMNNVYIPFVNVNNYIFDSFGAFTYLHSSTVFLQNILKSNSVSNKEMFVNVHQNNFQLIVIENNQLLLSNHFNYQTKEDFVYYILFVAEQLKMDPNQFSLTLYGNIKEKDEAYQLLYNYIRNVSIYATLNSKLGKNVVSLPQAHYNLLQLHI